jgi:hypothetical protein
MIQGRSSAPTPREQTTTAICAAIIYAGLHYPDGRAPSVLTAVCAARDIVDEVKWWQDDDD